MKPRPSPACVPSIREDDRSPDVIPPPPAQSWGPWNNGARRDGRASSRNEPAGGATPRAFRPPRLSAPAPRRYSAFARSRKANFCTFPVEVFGRSPNTTVFGHL